MLDGDDDIACSSDQEAATTDVQDLCALHSRLPEGGRPSRWSAICLIWKTSSGEDHHVGWFTVAFSLEVEEALTPAQSTGVEEPSFHRKDRVTRRCVRIHTPTHGLGAELVWRSGCAECPFQHCNHGCCHQCLHQTARHSGSGRAAHVARPRGRLRRTAEPQRKVIPSIRKLSFCSRLALDREPWHRVGGGISFTVRRVGKTLAGQCSHRLS